MKLFKSLLVAPAALGLLAPMSVTANELNITDVSDYSSSKEAKSIRDFDPAKELAVTNSRLDGLEARFNEFEAGAFSDTTSASFSVDTVLGAIDGNNPGAPGAESTSFDFQFNIGLSTSFTGEDSLDISLDAGNANGTLSEFDLNAEATTSTSTSAGDIVTVDGVSYTFPLGGATASVSYTHLTLPTIALV